MMGAVFERVHKRSDGVLVARLIDRALIPPMIIVLTKESLMIRIFYMERDGRDTSAELAAIHTIDTREKLEADHDPV